MIPLPAPPKLQGLSQVEEMLFARALPIMRVCINLPQNAKELASSLPKYPKDLFVIAVRLQLEIILSKM